MKLHYHTLRRLSLALGSGQESIGIGSKRKEDEQRTKSIKVLDLLQHSVDLGSNEALYTLAKVSLVRPFPFVFQIYLSSYSQY
jgi:SEL1 protein